MAKKKHLKKHATNINHNKNVVHIHIGDKKRRAAKSKKASSNPRSDHPHSHFSVQMPQTLAPQFHMNRPQHFDPMTQAQRENILGNTQVPVNGPVPVRVPVPAPTVRVPAPVPVSVPVPAPTVRVPAPVPVSVPVPAPMPFRAPPVHLSIPVQFPIPVRAPMPVRAPVPVPVPVPNSQALVVHTPTHTPQPRPTPTALVFTPAYQKMEEDQQMTPRKRQFTTHHSDDIIIPHYSHHSPYSHYNSEFANRMRELDIQSPLSHMSETDTELHVPANTQLALFNDDGRVKQKRNKVDVSLLNDKQLLVRSRKAETNKECNDRNKAKKSKK
jgi:hypothetical protein